MLSRIDKLTLGMLGDSSDPNLSAKGGEIRDILPFVVKELRSHVSKLGEGGEHMLKAGEHLLEWYAIVETCMRRMSVAAQRDLLDHYLNHVASYRAAGGICVPKHHQALYMCIMTHFWGNPKYYTTYPDESENGTAGRVAKRCHPMTFAKSFFQRTLTGQRLCVQL